MKISFFLVFISSHTTLVVLDHEDFIFLVFISSHTNISPCEDVLFLLRSFAAAVISFGHMSPLEFVIHICFVA